MMKFDGPYALVNGTKIANNWADLADGMLLVAITLTETGGAVPTQYCNQGNCSATSPLYCVEQ